MFWKEGEFNYGNIEKPKRPLYPVMFGGKVVLADTADRIQVLILAVSWLRSHYQEAFNLSELARQVNMSKASFSSFKSGCGFMRRSR